jgi:serine/threonine protein kinase
MEKQIEEGINYINESLLLKWLRECANALRYLHEEHEKIHRDIKPLNICLTKDNHAN